METFQTEPLNLTRTPTNSSVKSTRDLCMDCNSEYCIVKKLQAYRDEQSARSFQRFECKWCGKTYTTVSSLRKHQRTHVENKLFRCEICAELFADEYALKKHHIQHTAKEKHFECTICAKTFACQSSLSAHNRWHKNPQPAFQCNFCGKHFKWKSNLTAHLALHETQKFACELCHKIFESVDRLQVHRQKHENPDKQCRYCEKAFSNRYKVNYHIRLKHRNIAPWQCQFCSECFGTATKFRSHIYEFHDAPKPFACEKCDRTFLTKHNLNMHEAKHREDNEPFECDKCGNRFQYKRNLYSHMMRHLRNDGPNKSSNKKRDNFLPGQYLCEVCKRGYAYKMAALHCTHDRRGQYLQNETNNGQNTVNLATKIYQSDDGDDDDNDLMKVKISFVAENQTNQTIPLYEFKIPVVESTSRGIDSRYTKPALESEKADIKPVILVQAFTTPLNTSTTSSIKPNASVNTINRTLDSFESFCDSIAPEIIVIGDSNSDAET